MAGLAVLSQKCVQNNIIVSRKCTAFTILTTDIVFEVNILASLLLNFLKSKNVEKVIIFYLSCVDFFHKYYL